MMAASVDRRQTGEVGRTKGFYLMKEAQDRTGVRERKESVREWSCPIFCPMWWVSQFQTPHAFIFHLGF